MTSPILPRMARLPMAGPGPFTVLPYCQGVLKIMCRRSRSLAYAGGRGAGGGAGRTMLHPPTEIIVADHPVRQAGYHFRGILSKKEFPPQMLSPLRVRTEFLIPGIGREHRVGLAQGIRPATRPWVLLRTHNGRFRRLRGLRGGERSENRQQQNGGKEANPSGPGKNFQLFVTHNDTLFGVWAQCMFPASFHFIITCDFFS